ncbi:MAG: enoyl-CoA hydratase/isomerase family protein [Gracilibacteraceae bacterium]|jgi:enoyl-CoA hydratase|nr:enoyl-CoA hydratase/isomerase family protein [Gracilibacteraceae bacterium]
MNEYKFLDVSCRDGAALIGMNRAEAKNALNYGLLTEIVAACREADANEEIGVIILYSQIAGVYCAGADTKERRAMTDEEVKKRRIFARDCYDSLEKINKPLLTAVDGKCIGGGCEIIGTCDIILSSERASFRYVEVAVGSVGATQRVTRFVGRQHANELLFTGRTIGAAEAFAMGLVARILPAETFMEEVIKVGGQIASHPRATLLATKKAIKMAATAPPECGVMFEQMAIDYNLLKNDWRGSLDNFQQRTESEKTGVLSDGR